MKYFLTPNKLTEDNNYSGRIKVDQSYDLEAFIKLMLSKRNLVSETDIVAVLSAFFEEIEMCVQRGENVNLPIFNMSYSITGVFDDEDDSFDPERHKLHVNLNSSVELKAVIDDIRPSKVEAGSTSPQLKNVLDVSTQSVNNKITPGNIFELSGNRMKIAGDDNVGLFFVAKSDKQETKVETLATNTNKKLIGLTPALSTGQYNLLLRTQYVNSNSISKTVKVTISDFIVEVK
jgi:hypothetical protein